MFSLIRWSEVVENLKTLNQEKSNLEDLMIKDYLKNVTQTFTLPTNTRLNWRESSIVVSLNTKNVPIVEVRDWESPRSFNGRNSKDHLAGTSFLVLKEWKKENSFLNFIGYSFT